MILAILPAKGRAAQTLELIPRLLSTAGDVAWRLVVAVDDDKALHDRLQALRHPRLLVTGYAQRRGYWRILADISRQANRTSGGAVTHLVALANDLLPGSRWLERAHVAWSEASRDPYGPLVAFNDGIRFDHAAHCLISVALAQRWYGADCWPAMYDHLWADEELTARAREEGRFVSAPYAVLYHNHFLTGQQMDAVYQFSHTHESTDAALFRRRRANGWRS